MKKKCTYLSILVFCLASMAAGTAYPEGEWSWYRALQVERQPVLDVPYVPTPQEVVNKMLDIAGVNSKDVLYDLGCGDGRIVVTAAKQRKVRKAVGVDLDPRRIEQSNQNAREAGVSGRVTFHQKDLFEMDFSEASVVSLYLLPSVNQKLRPKLLKDLKPGTRIVSHDFDMGDWQADRIVTMNEHTIYYWVVPASVNGNWKWSVIEGETAHQYELRLGQRFQGIDKAELKVDNTVQEITNVGIAGNMLEFDTHARMDGREHFFHFSGIVRGNSIAGTFSEGKKAAGSRKWQGERDPATAFPVDAATAVSIQL